MSRKARFTVAEKAAITAAWARNPDGPAKTVAREASEAIGRPVSISSAKTMKTLVKSQSPKRYVGPLAALLAESHKIRKRR